VFCNWSDRLDQADAAHDGRLRPEIDGLAADVGIRPTERGNHLAHGQIVRLQPVLVDHHVIGAFLAAPAGHVDDAGNRAETTLQHPVLQGLEILDRVPLGATRR
jgi:hypothetical protein